MKIRNHRLLLLGLWSFVMTILSVGETNGNGRVYRDEDGWWSKQPRMDNERLDKLIQQLATLIEGEVGFWRIRYEERELFVITDETHNRLRIMTPIIQEERMTEHHLRLVLLANFDRALDAKYALASDYLWSIFTHPLAELTDDQFFDAFKQVKRLADSYGDTYASTDLIFGGG